MTAPPSLERGVLLRVLNVIQLMVDGQPAWGVRELARALGLPHTTTHRLLRKMQEEGLVEMEPVTGRYQIGPELFRLGLKIGSRLDLQRMAAPEMNELARATRETVYLTLYVRARRQNILVASVEPDTRLRFVPQLYEYLPIYYGASGRAILAFLPEADRQEVLQTEFAPVTESTITDRAELERTLEKVRSTGYAISMGERVAEAVSMAVPFWDAYGDVRGALVLCMPQWNYTPDRERECSPLLLAAAASLSLKLGGSPPPTRPISL